MAAVRLKSADIPTRRSFVKQQRITIKQRMEKQTMQVSSQIEKRRIFGIISHPDAGKTTLTEKLLLHGGAIREAGTVKARRNAKFATSDWMEIEKQRGISVTSSVMQFVYDDKVISIMDTPGHNDFGEDTYRILTSVDSAVMVMDGAKGIEAQTKKLFKVCSMRHIPIFTFINKLDREARDPLDLVQELEDVLGLPSTVCTWPVGSGQNFEGIYDLLENKLYLYKEKIVMDLGDEGVFSEELEDHLSINNLQALRDEIELIEGAGNPFDREAVDSGRLSPVFFGSALADFGVLPFLEHFLEMSPCPGPRKIVASSAANNGEAGSPVLGTAASGSSDGSGADSSNADYDLVYPSDDFFSGFIFKIQANMNPAHRDRLAFLRICSGTFRRGMNVKLTRTGKEMKLSQSTQLFANERETVDTAYAGDIIGIYDTGNYMIGDTLTDRKEPLFFEPLPTFPPELFSLVIPKNTMKAKHFQKGVEQLAQEGTIQVFRNLYNEVVVGAVGQLQLEVFKYRLENEYNSKLTMESLPYSEARWVDTSVLSDIDTIKDSLDSRSLLVFDYHQRPVILFSNQFSLNYYHDKNPDIPLLEAMEVAAQ